MLHGVYHVWVPRERGEMGVAGGGVQKGPPHLFKYLMAHSPNVTGSERGGGVEGKRSLKEKTSPRQSVMKVHNVENLSDMGVGTIFELCADGHLKVGSNKVHCGMWWQLQLFLMDLPGQLQNNAIIINLSFCFPHSVSV